MTQAASSQPVPAHVPAQLVRQFNFSDYSGTADALQATVDAAREMPDIFWGTGAHSRYSGAWVLTRHELQREVLQDTDSFSSRDTAGLSGLIGETWPLLPLEADGLDHGEWRKLLNPIFSPARMAVMEEKIAALAHDLVEGLATRGETEFMSEFAQVFPVQIFLEMFGLPLEQTRMFVTWEDGMLHGDSLDVQSASAGAIIAHLRAVIEDRIQSPRDDLISYVAQARINGAALTSDQRIGVCMLLYTAGIDTVANMLGFIFRHLAEHPDKQQSLRADPSLIPAAVEEMLRAFPIVMTSRVATRDVTFHGVQIKAGDHIMVPTHFAGRDGNEFADPDRIDFSRTKVSHITFAAGPHRCIGSHLARRELKLAIETWLSRVPPFRIAPGHVFKTSAQGVLTIKGLPLVWN